jgi:curved DNA-binding protein CbpA
MAGSSFRGDPYRVLDVKPDADDEAIKRRWRDLAREHHPDRTAGDTEAASRQTRQMARINAAYDLLRDTDRRERFDRSAEGRRAHDAAGTRPRRGGPAAGIRFDDDAPPTEGAPGGPPPPPRSRPVTARFDTRDLFHPRNSTTSEGPVPLRGQTPLSSRHRRGYGDDLRASQPNGPVRSHVSGSRAPLPTLEESVDTLLEFGRFRGHTLGEVADFEPTYIDWIASTITRDRDLVMRARVIQAEMDRRGVVRRPRAQRPGFGSRAAEEHAAG